LKFVSLHLGAEQKGAAEIASAREESAA
jgi:hypothetical protein